MVKEIFVNISAGQKISQASKPYIIHAVQLQSSIWGSFPGFYQLFKELPCTLKLKEKIQKGSYSLRKINKELIKF
jgi:hypothetical protein